MRGKVSYESSCFKQSKAADMYEAMRQHLVTQLQEIRTAGLFKSERVINTPQKSLIQVGDGLPVLNLCANNYLGLAEHPEVIRAAHQALDRWGYGLASVRFICGTQGVHKQLEQKISDFCRPKRRSFTVPVLTRMGGCSRRS
jgi:glycine C-acetyltransferase